MHPASHGPAARRTAHGCAEAIRSEAPGHGVVLLAEPGVRDALLSWLDQRVR